MRLKFSNAQQLSIWVLSVISLLTFLASVCAASPSVQHVRIDDSIEADGRQDSEQIFQSVYEANEGEMHQREDAAPTRSDLARFRRFLDDNTSLLKAFLDFKYNKTTIDTIESPVNLTSVPKSNLHSLIKIINDTRANETVKANIINQFHKNIQDLSELERTFKIFFESPAEKRQVIYDDYIYLRTALKLKTGGNMSVSFEAESRSDSSIQWVVLCNKTTILFTRTANKYYYWKIQNVSSAIIFCMIVVGNSSILYRLKFDNRKRSNMSYFIRQLAVADLTVGLFCVTSDGLMRIYKDFVLGERACLAIKYTTNVFIYSSTNLLVALTIDRWQAVVKPLAFVKSRSQSRYMVAISWILALIFALPVTIVSRIKEIDGHLQCHIDFSAEGWKYYLIYLTSSILVVPIFIIIVCYIHIVNTIMSRSRLMISRKNESALCKLAKGLHRKQKQEPKYPGRGPCQKMSKSKCADAKATDISSKLDVEMNSNLGDCGSDVKVKSANRQVEASVWRRTRSRVWGLSSRAEDEGKEEEEEVKDDEDEDEEEEIKIEGAFSESAYKVDKNGYRKDKNGIIVDDEGDRCNKAYRTAEKSERQKRSSLKTGKLAKRSHAQSKVFASSANNFAKLKHDLATDAVAIELRPKTKMSFQRGHALSDVNKNDKSTSGEPTPNDVEDYEVKNTTGVTSRTGLADYRRVECFKNNSQKDAMQSSESIINEAMHLENNQRTAPTGTRDDDCDHSYSPDCNRLKEPQMTKAGAFGRLVAPLLSDGEQRVGISENDKSKIETDADSSVPANAMVQIGANLRGRFLAEQTPNVLVGVGDELELGSTEATQTEPTATTPSSNSRGSRGEQRVGGVAVGQQQQITCASYGQASKQDESANREAERPSGQGGAIKISTHESSMRRTEALDAYESGHKHLAAMGMDVDADEPLRWLKVSRSQMELPRCEGLRYKIMSVSGGHGEFASISGDEGLEGSRLQRHSLPFQEFGCKLASRKHSSCNSCAVVHGHHQSPSEQGSKVMERDLAYAVGSSEHIDDDDDATAATSKRQFASSSDLHCVGESNSEANDSEQTVVASDWRHGANSAVAEPRQNGAWHVVSPDDNGSGSGKRVEEAPAEGQSGAKQQSLQRVIRKSKELRVELPSSFQIQSRQKWHSFGNGGRDQDFVAQHGNGLIPMARIKTIKMTLAIVFAYIICWSPFIVYNICIVFKITEDNVLSLAISTYTQSLVHLNSAVNPIIYWLFSSRRNETGAVKVGPIAPTTTTTTAVRAVKIGLFDVKPARSTKSIVATKQGCGP